MPTYFTDDEREALFIAAGHAEKWPRLCRRVWRAYKDRGRAMGWPEVKLKVPFDESGPIIARNFSRLSSVSAGPAGPGDGHQFTSAIEATHFLAMNVIEAFCRINPYFLDTTLHRNRRAAVCTPRHGSHPPPASGPELKCLVENIDSLFRESPFADLDGLSAMVRSERFTMMGSIVNEARPIARERIDNGPTDRGSFFWDGEEFSLQPIDWRLVTFMWEKDHIQIDAVDESVWGGTGGAGALKSAMSRANKVLLESGCGRDLHVRSGKLYWIDPTEKVAEKVSALETV